jgi:hypothetical protein
MLGNIPSKKKIRYPVRDRLLSYLSYYNRLEKLPLQYSDLLRYNAAIPVIGHHNNKETGWESVFYPESDQIEIYNHLKLIYAFLKTGGDISVMEHLTIARIDYCTFGNSKPFRIRIINRLNDNYDHFYIKITDASRIYGLELESLLSPNYFYYLIDGDTLIEEHIAGIPGDDFIHQRLKTNFFNQIRIIKEFVKFNERCFARLLGDMRSYNYVVDITPDIEGNQYRMRAIDFDQQSFEGAKRFYQPQYFKENNPIITMGINHIGPQSVKQYQMEERSLITERIRTEQDRVNSLFRIFRTDQISTEEKIEQLRKELFRYHGAEAFNQAATMGEITQLHLEKILNKPVIDWN